MAKYTGRGVDPATFLPKTIQGALEKRPDLCYSDAFAEDGNGYWVYLVGFRCVQSDTHSVHEHSAKETSKAIRLAEKCDCRECRGEG